MKQQWQRLSAAMLAACLMMGTLPAVAEEAPEEANTSAVTVTTGDSGSADTAQEQPTVEQSSGEGEISVVTAAKAVRAKSGTCGKKLKWKLDKQGTLTIYGSGKMKTFKTENDTVDTPWNKDEIKKLVVKKGCTYISESAFSGCTRLEQVSFPNNLKKIEKDAFSNCTSLKRVKLPSALRTVRRSCFANCTNLEEVILPKKLLHLQGYVFENCKNLRAITLPTTLKDISMGTFKRCTSLTEVRIPENVIIIGGNAFYGCMNLKEVTITSKTMMTDGAFRYKEDGKYYQIPAHYTVPWGSEAFQRVVESGCDYTAVGEKVLNEPTISVGNGRTGVFGKWKYVGAFDRGIWYRAEGDGEYQQCKIATETSENYLPDVHCTNGTWYTYKVAIQWSDYSRESKPQKVYYLERGKVEKVSKAGKGRAKVYWKENSAADGYLLRYDDCNEKGIQYKYITIKNNKTASYTLKNLNSGHRYSFDVIAYKTFGKKTYYGTWSESGWSKVK